MHVKIRTAVMLLLAAFSVSARAAQEPAEAETQDAQQAPTQPEYITLQGVKEQLDAMNAEHEKRIRELEAQVEQLQARMLQAAEPESQLQPQVQPVSQAAGGAVQFIPGALNPALSVIGNFLGRADSRKVFNEEADRIDNKLNLREAEVDMRVPVDPYADAVLITSFESETPGHFSTDVEEGYVNIKKFPFLDRNPLGLRLKVGHFRPAFGKTNVLHTHDLPQSFRPLPIQEFLGADGFIQNGISGNFFIPTPANSNSTLDATVEVLNGGDVAISPDLDSRASYLGHLRWFNTLGVAHNLELGASSYFRPSGVKTSSVNFHGFDFMYRWKPLRQGEWKSYILGGELLLARRAYPEASEPEDVARSMEGLQPGHGKPIGYTLFTQWQLDRRKYGGVRWDRTTTLFDPGLKRRSLTPYLSYYFSEFLRFRLNYERRWSDIAAEDGRNSVFFELNWVFGAHPPEPFWVNK
ncbi:MAG: hypothetical protein HY315_01095 [Acidobacteria bacterium]|nr:hypothetical protein [Acidobacteriota bacterium]